MFGVSSCEVLRSAEMCAYCENMRHTDRRTAEHSSLTATQRSQRARIAAGARWAKADGHAGTQAARDAFMARFEAEVDPHRVLPPAERTRRADSARRAYFQRMAFNRGRKSA